MKENRELLFLSLKSIVLVQCLFLLILMPGTHATLEENEKKNPSFLQMFEPQNKKFQTKDRNNLCKWYPQNT